MSTPTVITLTPEVSVSIVVKYLEHSLSSGTFTSFEEADPINRSINVIVHNAQDHEITRDKAKDILFDGLRKGLGHGDYKFNDASLIFNTMNYINAAKVMESPLKHQPSPVAVPAADIKGKGKATDQVIGNGDLESEDGEDDDDLFDVSELSKPVVLKPMEI